MARNATYRRDQNRKAQQEFRERRRLLVEGLQKENESLRKENENLQRENENLQRENGSLQRGNEEWEEYDEKDDSCKLQEENAELRRNNRLYNSDYEELQRLYEALVEENWGLKLQVQDRVMPILGSEGPVGTSPNGSCQLVLRNHDVWQPANTEHLYPQPQEHDASSYLTENTYETLNLCPCQRHYYSGRPYASAAGCVSPLDQGDPWQNKF